MKITSKRILSVIGVTLGTVIITAAPSFADSASCANIGTLATTSNNTISAKVTMMNGDFQTRLSSITSGETMVGQQITSTRQTLISQFETKVEALKNAANWTASQKDAIATYQTTVEKAEKARENIVDQSRDAYRSGLLATVQTQQSDLADAVTNFQTSVTSAFTAAQSNCNNSNAMPTLKTAVKSARATLTTDRTSNAVTTEINRLMTARNNLIKDANATFAAAVKKASTTLTAVIGTTTPAPNTTSVTATVK